MDYMTADVIYINQQYPGRLGTYMSTVGTIFTIKWNVPGHKVVHMQRFTRTAGSLIAQATDLPLHSNSRTVWGSLFCFLNITCTSAFFQEVWLFTFNLLFLVRSSSCFFSHFLQTMSTLSDHYWWAFNLYGARNNAGACTKDLAVIVGEPLYTTHRTGGQL